MNMDEENLDPFEYSNTCPDVFNGGKESCDGQDCECAQDGETVCMIGICVCMHQRHLAYDQVSCNNINHAQILKTKNHSELNCPTTCLATSENNSCPPSSSKREDGKCFCDDGTQVKPTITKDYRLHMPLVVCPNIPVPKSTNVTHDLHPGIIGPLRNVNITSHELLVSFKNRCNKMLKFLA